MAVSVALFLTQVKDLIAKVEALPIETTGEFREHTLDRLKRIQNYVRGEYIVTDEMESTYQRLNRVVSRWNAYTPMTEEEVAL